MDKGGVFCGTGLNGQILKAPVLQKPWQGVGISSPRGGGVAGLLVLGCAGGLRMLVTVTQARRGLPGPGPQTPQAPGADTSGAQTTWPLSSGTDGEHRLHPGVHYSGEHMWLWSCHEQAWGERVEAVRHRGTVLQRN